MKRIKVKTLINLINIKATPFKEVMDCLVCLKTKSQFIKCNNCPYHCCKECFNCNSYKKNSKCLLCKKDMDLGKLGLINEIKSDIFTKVKDPSKKIKGLSLNGPTVTSLYLLPNTLPTMDNYTSKKGGIWRKLLVHNFDGTTSKPNFSKQLDMGTIKDSDFIQTIGRIKRTGSKNEIYQK